MRSRHAAPRASEQELPIATVRITPENRAMRLQTFRAAMRTEIVWSGVVRPPSALFG